MYATIQDMIDRFGEEEMIQLTDRAETQTNSINTVLLQAKLDDACHELNVMLSCCYDIRSLKVIVDTPLQIPVLKHWQCDITRKHLYDSLENQNNQVNFEYKDYEEEVKKLCENGELYDENYNLINKKIIALFNEDPGCYPSKPCCCEEPCGCRGAVTWAE